MFMIKGRNYQMVCFIKSNVIIIIIISSIVQKSKSSSEKMRLWQINFTRFNFFSITS